MFDVFVGCCILFLFFFFNDTATTEIYTLSLHDALPIFTLAPWSGIWPEYSFGLPVGVDRKSTRLNSSHGSISYAVFCLKKQKESDTPKTATLIESLRLALIASPTQ